LVANYQRNSSKAATCRSCNTQLIIFIVLIFNNYSLDAFDVEINEHLTAFIDVPLGVSTLFHQLIFNFCEGRPELDRLRAELLILTAGSLRSYLANLVKEELNRIVLLSCNLN
jgi:hypothetical protein